MNVKTRIVVIISLFTLVIAAFFFLGMDREDGSEQLITLKSSDGVKVVLPRKVAEQSKTIKTIIDGFQEGQPPEISFRYISGETLQQITDDMNQLYNTTKSRKILQQRVNIRSLEKLFALLSAADFLDTHDLLLMYAGAVGDYLISQEDPKEFYQLYKDKLSQNIWDEIAKYVYKVGGIPLPIQSIYEGLNRGYSFRINTMPYGVGYSLVLDDLGLNSLHGLNLIRDVAFTTYLFVKNNNIKNIDMRWFKGLSELVRLELKNNNIETFQTDRAKVIPRVRYLDLRDNNITDLPIELFDIFPRLEEIILTNNPITNERIAEIQQKLKAQGKDIEIVKHRRRDVSAALAAAGYED
ncbi:MAG: leucine-rich repeat domain-containing protein [Candidatus Dependentiae bacterium]